MGYDLSELRQKGFGGKAGFGTKPALVVIDFAKAFTDPSHALGSDVSVEIDETNALVHRFQQRDFPIFYMTIEYETPEAAAASNWRDKIEGIVSLYRGSRDSELDDRLKLRPQDHVIPKKYASSFFGTELAHLLQQRDVDTVVITGCATSGCVRATAVDACQYGLRAVVCREAVADRDRVAHAQALVDIDLKYGDVLSRAEIEQWLTGITK